MNRSGPDLVFVGPSLSHEEAAVFAPEAVLLPPAAMGDVISALERYRPHAIVLIDGGFQQSLSVFHKELIEAMARGVWVIGASSMGALRAAECATYGMIPIGEIAAAFLTGELEGDDEVALVHADATDGYRPLSDAMVEIRATILAAAAIGLLSFDDANRLIDGQKRRWFVERSLAAAELEAREQFGWSEEQSAAFGAFIRSDRVDQKSRDAREALRALVALPAGPMPESQRPPMPSSTVYRAMVAHDRLVGDESSAVRLDDIRTHAALTDPTYPSDWRRARQRAVMLKLAIMLDLEPSPEALGRARDRVATAFGVEINRLEEEAAALDLSVEELATLVREEAALSGLEEWISGRASDPNVARAYQNQLRLDGRYRPLREAAKLIESFAAISEERDVEARFDVAVVNHMAMSSFVPRGRFEDYIESSGFENANRFYDRLMTHVIAERAILGISGGLDLESPAAGSPDPDLFAVEMNARGAR